MRIKSNFHAHVQSHFPILGIKVPLHWYKFTQEKKEKKKRVSFSLDTMFFSMFEFFSGLRALFMKPVNTYF